MQVNRIEKPTFEISRTFPISWNTESENPIPPMRALIAVSGHQMNEDTEPGILLASKD
jgi:hypothetical protein